MASATDSAGDRPLTYAIETSGLTHHFSPADRVLDDISLRVPIGSIYGFLGPNGAGKTTTLRLVLGLLRQQHGGIEIFGMRLRRNRMEILRRVGSSIESPSIYAHLTARQNLSLWRIVFQCPATRIDEVLQLVGLAHTGSKRAGQFSLGMKQRLSIAVALLHDPSLLILDEPTNGLDPHGILEMRDLLIALNRDHGTTILVSSHLLSEIERLVTHVGIINRGRMLFQGAFAELSDKRKPSTIIDTSDNARALAIVTDAGFETRTESERLILAALPPPEIGRLNRLLVEAGVDVYQIASGGNDLEKIFLEMIGDSKW
ncbi:MAG: ABC transporter ATP-binding protein [Acidobacteria bacterium]|nr:ABC transporter ATP-binding protein [Acidobacteriota bacterium]